LFDDELSRLKKEMLEFKRKADAEAKKKAAEEQKRLEDAAISSAIQEEERRKVEALEKGTPIENIVPVQPAIVPEVIVQTKKISEMNSSKVHTRRTKKIIISNFVKFVRSLKDDELKLYLEPNMKVLNAERSKYDYEAKSTFEGIEFTFDESVV
jgi:hypothetical protein